MANGFEITRYKQQLISLIINNSAIVNLIDNKEIESVEDLIGENVFNFIRILESPEDEKTWIALEVDMPEVYSSGNHMFKKILITIYIITHERLMPTEYGGTRIDLISHELDKMLNGYTEIGKKPLELISNVSQAISVKHRCRIMKFKAEETNLNKCLDKMVK